jgi:thymidylate synthase (FAD)
MNDFKVELLTTIDSQALSVAGALGCFEQKSSAQIYRELKALPEQVRLKKERVVLKNSLGRGHGSVGDQSYFIFSLEDVPRLVTLTLCLPEYLAHLQQSLRRANSSRGFHLSDAIRNSKFNKQAQKILTQSFKLYEQMCQSGIPKEDARFILPLLTRTNIQTAGNARELSHLWFICQQNKTPCIVKSVVNEMVYQAKKQAPYLFENYGYNYQLLAWYPTAQLFYSSNPELERLIEKNEGGYVSLVGWHAAIMPTEETMVRAIEQKREEALANLKHVHFSFLCSMSIACLHQAIRQRTWNHSVESLYHAIRDKDENRMVVPPSIKKSRFASTYRQQHWKMIELFSVVKKNGVPESEAIGVIPHSVKIYTLVHINGWNAIHAIGKRTCLAAQWEIRRITRKIAGFIKKEIPTLGFWQNPNA